jgi:hypothetical protein
VNAVLYPRAITISGNPAQHGLADLALVFDTNDVHDTHIVITAEQLLDLQEQIIRKLGE